MKFLNEKFKNSYNKRKFDEIKHFHDINKGLRETYLNINNTLDNINDWDELLNLNDEEQKLENIKVKENFQKCKCLFDFFGVIFCVLQLIIVQSNIIILNSLFNEIVEEFKLMIKKTSREYNFYERLEINSYREIPEIDVGMITSSMEEYSRFVKRFLKSPARSKNLAISINLLNEISPVDSKRLYVGSAIPTFEAKSF